ncbi:malate synthase A [Brevibacterium sp. UCMA 11752]|uniref:malate synthase A n=1 Tax=Brevibacterium sp. UCMA 11752 TaxID=2745946 RepID=UPI001F2897EB|nr:malate synthase A [Brevibacterium sp. UCMA 11752]MCF2585942.1 malate synthase A [Brevibacterium sp. UCMA 11752]
MSHIKINAPIEPGFDTILSESALNFIAALHDRFSDRLGKLLGVRGRQAQSIRNGTFPRFTPDTAGIRADTTWKVAGATGAPGLEDRRVELTGPVSEPEVVAALNSRAKVWLADLEDATSPTWANVIGGQLNLFNAIRGNLPGVNNREQPTIGLRPRGWHLPEKHLIHVDDKGSQSETSGAMVDFGLYFFHNARRLVDNGSGPYFYLPKLESFREARLWNEIFVFAQDYMGIPQGTIRATVHIETITAVFQMEEILWELRDHCAGLNAAGWDYLFSLVKNFRNSPEWVLPDREHLTMGLPLLQAFADRLVSTCHRRGAHAIGTMGNLMTTHPDKEFVASELVKMREDKAREASRGFDGTWVAEPGLVNDALEVFDAALGDKPNQLDNRRVDAHACAEHMLDVSGLDTTVTEEGVRLNIRVAIGYMNEWLGGNGNVALENLLEDASTAEISRSQIWQWIRHSVTLDNGKQVTRDLVERYMGEELAVIERHPADHYTEAVEIFRKSALGEDFPEFLTMPAYTDHLVDRVSKGAVFAA